jgi:predicted ArsR family transcriptional regulator
VYWRANREVSASLPERRYERVAELFASALERLGDDPLPAALQDVAREMGAQLAAPRRGTPRSRLTAALAAGGYEPVADASGAIRLRNCPFRALATTHRRLVCNTNLEIAEGVVTGSGATEVRPVLELQPDGCCVVFDPDDE